jgi:hypothetical protein
MEWLLVGALVIIWAAFLLSPVRRGSSPNASVQEFERNMGLLAETERATGRWIVAPRKGERFVGDAQRIRQRSRERRRRVFVALLEAAGLTLLIGVFPPLRGMWLLTAALGGVLVVYVCVLLKMKQMERMQDALPVSNGSTPPTAKRRVPLPRPLYDERGALGEDDLVHVIVRSARELQVAGA